VDLHGAWEQGQRTIEERQRALCAGDVPGDTHRRLEVRNRVAGVRCKHALLSVWSLADRYRGEVDPVLVNGQTGRVLGKAPLDPAGRPGTAGRPVPRVPARGSASRGDRGPGLPRVGGVSSG